MLEWLSSRRQEAIGATEEEVKINPFPLLLGNINWSNHYGKQYGGSYTSQNRPTLQSTIHFCEYTQKEMITIIRPCIHTYAYGSTPEDVHEVTSNLDEV